MGVFNGILKSFIISNGVFLYVSFITLVLLITGILLKKNRKGLLLFIICLLIGASFGFVFTKDNTVIQSSNIISVQVTDNNKETGTIKVLADGDNHLIGIGQFADHRDSVQFTDITMENGKVKGNYDYIESSLKDRNINYAEFTGKSVIYEDLEDTMEAYNLQHRKEDKAQCIFSFIFWYVPELMAVLYALTMIIKTHKTYELEKMRIRNI